MEEQGMIWDDVTRLLRLAAQELKLAEDYLEDCEYEANIAVEKLDKTRVLYGKEKEDREF